LINYNWIMRTPKLLPWCIVVIFLAGVLCPIYSAQANLAAPRRAPSSAVTAYDLIMAMNTLRTSYGLPALIEDPIINAVAQATAETMAANLMSWHIGDVRGRIAAAGYGGGASVFATENFAVGTLSIDEIMVIWSDPDHMRPAVNAAYCNVGAGVATASNGKTYYVLQAAYVSGSACGDYTSTGGSSSTGTGSTTSQVIVPVNIATPDADGNIYHIVQVGQSYWSIAITYQITIHDIEVWNNLSRNTPLQPNQKLFIPGKNTIGYATPTPVGMIVPSAPDADGKIVHVVQAYQSLIPIADAYDVTMDTILALNGLKEEWPLQIGQKLLIYPGNITPSPTPRPLTPIEKLTPAEDGNYYHVVKSGETLSWIAGLYDISLADLMAWNGLNSESIIWPDEKLLLQVTPPVTITPTPGPPTATLMDTPTPRLATATRTPIHTATPGLTTTPAPESQPGGFNYGWAIGAVLMIVGVLLWVGIARRRVKRDA
jgi:LysM repeat protein